MCFRSPYWTSGRSVMSDTFHSLNMASENIVLGSFFIGILLKVVFKCVLKQYFGIYIYVFFFWGGGVGEGG